MKTRNVLIPLDVAACPLEVFSFVNETAKEEGTAVTLLHVSKLNVAAPDIRLYVEMEEEIQKLLLRLKTDFVSPRVDSNFCVRWGRPAREILAQAAEASSDLIVLTNCSGHRRKRLFKADIVSEVIAGAPCPVRVLKANSRFDFTTTVRTPEKESFGVSFRPALKPLIFRPELTPSYARLQGC
jgi:nucleotide-binding universal stress UspA family protein